MQLQRSAQLTLYCLLSASLLHFISLLVHSLSCLTVYNSRQQLTSVIRWRGSKYLSTFYSYCPTVIKQIFISLTSLQSENRYKSTVKHVIDRISITISFAYLPLHCIVELEEVVYSLLFVVVNIIKYCWYVSE